MWQQANGTQTNQITRSSYTSSEKRQDKFKSSSHKNSGNMYRVASFVVSCVSVLDEQSPSLSICGWAFAQSVPRQCLQVETHGRPFLLHVHMEDKHFDLHEHPLTRGSMFSGATSPSTWVGTNLPPCCLHPQSVGFRHVWPSVHQKTAWKWTRIATYSKVDLNDP